MQKFSNYLTKGIVIVFLFVSAISLYSCGGGRPSEADLKRFEETKLATIEQINNTKIDLEKQIAVIDSEIKNAQGQAYEDLQLARNELVGQVEMLEEELLSVREATLNTWDQVIENTTTTLNQVKDQANELSTTVREWLNPVQE